MFFTVAASFHNIPAGNVKWFQFVIFLPTLIIFLFVFQFFIMIILANVKWCYVIVPFICVELKINESEHLFMCTLTVYILPLDNCLILHQFLLIDCFWFWVCWDFWIYRFIFFIRFMCVFFSLHCLVGIYHLTNIFKNLNFFWNFVCFACHTFTMSKYCLFICFVSVLEVFFLDAVV